jgi:hypothetical protein|tara:strand:- start:762 stop:902 length:141 start_codon:yes stop_codon:yes gene_type:complete
MNYKIFSIWLLLVVVWNFGYPSVPPIADVIVAVVLSLLNKYLERII